ncbi:MAG: fibronectin type III domain-containing protein [Anaerovoracaceae bacterium]
MKANQRKIMITITTFILLAIVFALVAVAAAVEPLPAVQNLKVSRVSNTSLKLAWTKNLDATGYFIYRLDLGKKTYKKVKSINSNSVTSWKNKKLKKNKKYKYKIRAYKVENGQTFESVDSYTVYAITNTKKAKKANVASIRFGNGRSTEYLGLERWYKKDIKALLSKSDKKAKKKLISTRLTLSSSNLDIVKIVSGGAIKAQGKKGTATVTVRSHNGIQKKIYITVDDYANPANFENLDKIPGAAKKLLVNSPDKIKKIMDILEKQAIKSGTEVEYFGGALGGAPTDVQFGEDYSELEEFFKAEDIYIYCYGSGTYAEEYMLAAGGGDIIYSPRKNITSVWKKNGGVQLAPCWYFAKGGV